MCRSCRTAAASAVSGPREASTAPPFGGTYSRLWKRAARRPRSSGRARAVLRAGRPRDAELAHPVGERAGLDAEQLRSAGGPGYPPVRQPQRGEHVVALELAQLRFSQHLLRGVAVAVLARG